ncbi:MAG: hypothetical protein FWD91_00775 [Treponema sp.]|nr:hypothetical protein [Treponema sp.]
MRISTAASLILFTVCICGAAPADAQNTQSERVWWYTLEEGKLLFRSGDYGNALVTFDKARRTRHAQFTRLEQDLIRLLSTAEARTLGDSLFSIERLISFRNETAAAAALDYLFHRVSRESVGGSAARVLEELERQKNFPEADFWMGETFMAEGELALALTQYQRAWDNRALLETPGFDVQILYCMTTIRQMRQEYIEMERLASQIITGDSPGHNRDNLWASGLLRAAMVRLLESEGIHRFISLYRHDNIVTERAHRLLGFFFTDTRRDISAAEHLMFAFLIQNTIIIDDIIRRQFDFTFTTLDDLMTHALVQPALVEFMEETEYFRTAFHLSTALASTGKTIPAMQLWAFLAASPNAGVWGERARANPVPYSEPAIELP